MTDPDPTPAESSYLAKNAATLALIGAGVLLFLTVLAFHLAKPAPPNHAPTASPLAHGPADEVDPIDAAASLTASDDPEARAAETPAGPAAMVTCPDCGHVQTRLTKRGAKRGACEDCGAALH